MARTDRKCSVLVVGDEEMAGAIERVEGVPVHRTYTAAATEGIGIDVVVVAGDYPLEELTEVRVHPRLYDLPVVLVVPGHTMRPAQWHGIDVWPVTATKGAAEEVVRIVDRLLCRERHPATQVEAVAS